MIPQDLITPQIPHFEIPSPCESPCRQVGGRLSALALQDCDLTAPFFIRDGVLLRRLSLKKWPQGKLLPHRPRSRSLTPSLLSNVSEPQLVQTYLSAGQMLVLRATYQPAPWFSRFVGGGVLAWVGWFFLLQFEQQNPDFFFKCILHFLL